jgi:hypothetical protein
LEFSQINLIAGLRAFVVAGSSVQACINIRTSTENFADGTEVRGFQQECALLRVEFSPKHEGALEQISFALGAVVEADAHFHPLQRKFLAPSLKTYAHSGARGERCAKKVVRIGTRRYVADAIWAADRKLRFADMANQRTMIGRVACDDNFADLGHDQVPIVRMIDPPASTSVYASSSAEFARDLSAASAPASAFSY